MDLPAGLGFRLTNHARVQMARRGISANAVETVVEFGRQAYVRGARIFAIGRNEIHRLAKCGVKLESFHGVHVVCDPTESVVITVYRNRCLKGLRR